MNLLYYQFKLQSFWKFTAIILSIHTGAILTICFIDILWFVRLLSIVYICQSCYNYIKKYALLERSESIIVLWYDGDGKWFLTNKDQEILAATISYPIFISKVVIIINFFLRKRFRKIRVVVLAGMIKRDDFRKLKMLLKLIAR